MEGLGYTERAHKMIFLGGVILLVGLLLRFLWVPMLPFALSWLISLPVRGVAGRVSEKTKIPFGAAAACCLVLCFVSVGGLLWLGIRALCGEILDLYSSLSQNPELILDFFRGVEDKMTGAGGIFSFFEKLLKNEELSGLAGGVEEAVSDTVASLIISLGEKLSGGAVSLAAKLPSALLFCLTFFLSCFYFCCDEGKISGFFASLLSEGSRTRILRWSSQIKGVLTGYLLATISLCGITLFVVLCGLLCIGCRYAILLSLVIAIIDALPLLGAGIILLPWSLVCFLGGDVAVGVALIIIWVIVTVARQVAEPRLLGKKMGLHPLAVLMSVYVGAEIFGFAGMIAGPLVAVGIKSILPIIKEKPRK